MAERKPKKLPEAEYFKLVDGRGESSFLYKRGRQYHDVPEASEPLRRAHYARWDAMDPDWRDRYPPMSPIAAKGEHNFPLPPELAPKFAVFRKAWPVEVAHYDVAWGYGYDPVHGYHNQNIYIVSTAWKQAIESVEPGVHEFFPFELRFKNCVVTDHFMFRNRQVLDLVDVEKSDYTKYSDPNREGKGFVTSKASFLSVKRSVVSGQHWMEYSHLTGIHFVSRELAIKLQSLLPRRCKYMPVSVSDAS